MTDEANSQPLRSSIPRSPSRSRRGYRSWILACLCALGALVVLGWLLARLIWLPLYFGLFFFLVAGLLVGAPTFRIARPARPIKTRRLLCGIGTVSVLSTLMVVFWEYRHIAATAGSHPRFAVARTAAAEAGQPLKNIRTRAKTEFVRRLEQDHPPGGVIGYVSWAVTKGNMILKVDSFEDEVSIEHRGLAWPLRTVAAILLLAAGLWASLESLRSPIPVSNIIAPGEEADEEDENES